MRYLHPMFWPGEVAPIKTYNLTVDKPTKQLTFEAACYEYALKLHNMKPINIMYSGGVDSTHVLCVFLDLNLDVTVTYTQRSIDEFPSFFELLSNHKNVTLRHKEQDAKTELDDFIMKDYFNLYGDPEPHGLAVYRNQHLNDEYSFSDDITTFKSYANKKNTDYLIKETAGWPINTMTEFMVFQEEFMNPADNLVMLANKDNILDVIPFYADANIIDAVRRDRRFWQLDARVYKYVQKQLIYKHSHDKDYYLYKDKRGSAGMYKHQKDVIYAITDDFTAITNKKEAYSLLKEHLCQQNNQNKQKNK